jgi:hypothetical protein
MIKVEVALLGQLLVLVGELTVEGVLRQGDDLRWPGLLGLAAI